MDVRRLLKQSKGSLEWTAFDGFARAAQVAPTAVLFELGGTVGSPAATLIADAMARFVTAPATVLFWDLAAVREYSSDVRDAALGSLREKNSQIHKIYVYAVGAPWTVRMGINLANLVLLNRVEPRDDRASFLATLTEVVGPPV